MKTLSGSLLLWVMAAAATSAQQHNKSGLAGVVRDSMGTPIPQASVFVAGGKGAEISDDSGRFDVRGLPGGKNEITITKIGFSAVSFTATLPEDSVVVVAVMLHRVRVLDPVTITAVAARERLTRTGFYDRQRSGLGQYLTPEQIDSMADRVQKPSELLRDMRGVTVRCGRSTCLPTVHNAPCLRIFIDGEPVGTAAELDELGYSPASMAAVELYDRAANVPLEYHRVDGCAIVLFWTKLKASK